MPILSLLQVWLYVYRLFTEIKINQLWQVKMNQLNGESLRGLMGEAAIASFGMGKHLFDQSPPKSGKS